MDAKLLDQYSNLAANAIRSQYKLKTSRDLPTVQVVIAAGSAGLGDLESEIEEAVSIDFTNIPHWPTGTITGHTPKLILGYLHGAFVAMPAGRIHQYQDYDYHDVSFGYLALRKLTSKDKSTPPILISTHAVGAINPINRFYAMFGKTVENKVANIGDILVSESGFYLFDSNQPYYGMPEAYGAGPFVPCTNQYDALLRKMTQHSAKKLDDTSFKVHDKGVTLVLDGAKFETTAEISFLKTSFLPYELKVVGMSGNETLMAHKMGYRVIDLAGITNMTVGMEEMRQREKTIDLQILQMAVEQGVPVWQLGDHLKGLEALSKGPSHEEVVENQAIVGKNLQLLINQMVRDYNFK